MGGGRDGEGGGGRGDENGSEGREGLVERERKGGSAEGRERGFRRKAWEREWSVKAEETVR